MKDEIIKYLNRTAKVDLPDSTTHNNNNNTEL